MSVHDNYMDTYRCSPTWDAETTIHDMFGEPLDLRVLGRRHQLSAMAVHLLYRTS